MTPSERPPRHANTPEALEAEAEWFLQQGFAELGRRAREGGAVGRGAGVGWLKLARDRFQRARALRAKTAKPRRRDRWRL